MSLKSTEKLKELHWTFILEACTTTLSSSASPNIHPKDQRHWFRTSWKLNSNSLLILLTTKHISAAHCLGSRATKLPWPIIVKLDHVKGAHYELNNKFTCEIDKFKVPFVLDSKMVSYCVFFFVIASKTYSAITEQKTGLGNEVQVEWGGQTQVRVMNGKQLQTGMELKKQKEGRLWRNSGNRVGLI